MTTNFIGKRDSGRLRAMFEGLESRMCLSAFDGTPVLVDAAPALRADSSTMSRHMLRLMTARAGTAEPAAWHIAVRTSAADAPLRKELARIAPRPGTSADSEADGFIKNLIRVAPTDAAREWLTSVMRSDDARAAIRAAMVHENNAGVSPKEKFATLFVNQFEQLLKIWPGPGQQMVSDAPPEDTEARPPIQREPDSAPATAYANTTPPPHAITPPVVEAGQPENTDAVASVVPAPGNWSARRVDHLIEVLEESAVTYGGSAAAVIGTSLSRYLVPVTSLMSGYSISSWSELPVGVVEPPPPTIAIVPVEPAGEANGDALGAAAVMAARTFDFAHFGAPFTLLADSVAAFVEDSASIAAAALAQTRVTTQPWLLTICVIAADVVLLTYVHRGQIRFRGSYAATHRGVI